MRKCFLIVPALIAALLSTTWATLNFSGFSVESFSTRAQIFRAVGAYANFLDNNEPYYGSPDHPGFINLLLGRACKKFDAWGAEQNKLTADESQKSNRQLVIDCLKQIFTPKVLKATYLTARLSLIEAISDFQIGPQALADLRQIRPIIAGDVPKVFLVTRRELCDSLNDLYDINFRDRPSGYWESCGNFQRQIEHLDSLQNFNDYDYRIIQNNPDLRKTLIWCIDDLVKELNKFQP